MAFLGESATAAVVTAASLGGTEVEVEGGEVGGGRRNVRLVTVHC